MTLRLIRATPENGVFTELRAEWIKQLSDNEGAPSEYYTPMMDHAENIAAENPQSKDYGIFALLRHDVARKTTDYEGLVHVNHAFAISAKPVLRLVWNLIAPKYQYEDVDLAQFAQIQAAFLIEALKLSRDVWRSVEIKFYLGNAVDREYMTAAAAFLQTNHPKLEFAVRGNWVHIKP